MQRAIGAICSIGVASLSGGHDRVHAETIEKQAVPSTSTLPSVSLPSIQPSRHATRDETLRLHRGRSLFERDWVGAPASTTLRDGLGPLFNARSCAGCHAGDQRLHDSPNGNGEPVPAPAALVAKIPTMRSAASRASIVAQWRSNALNGLRPVRSMDDALARPMDRWADELAGLGRVLVQWQRTTLITDDGEAFEVRRPEYRIQRLVTDGWQWRGGRDDPPGSANLFSARMAPSLLAVATIEAVPDQWIRDGADPDDENRDGISGRIRVVSDARTGTQRIGRFGWRADLPDLHHATAAGFAADIGITNDWFPASDCDELPIACTPSMDGNGPVGSHEIAEFLVDDVVAFLVAASERRTPTDEPRVPAIFRQTGCAGCHRVGPPGVRLFSDLLLHDMGVDLADPGRDDDSAGREWRTAPLVGVEGRLARTGLLHDGRARTVAEAILWHGGEGARASSAFRSLSSTERQRLIALVESF